MMHTPLFNTMAYIGLGSLSVSAVSFVTMWLGVIWSNDIWTKYGASGFVIFVVLFVIALILTPKN